MSWIDYGSKEYYSWYRDPRIKHPIKSPKNRAERNFVPSRRASEAPDEIASGAVKTVPKSKETLNINNK